jgi:hypothetical protein
MRSTFAMSQSEDKPYVERAKTRLQHRATTAAMNIDRLAA